jgi:hypothetical protein
MQFPTTALPICLGSTPDREIASFITTPASSAGSMFASDPPNAPMAERAALNTTTSLVISIFLVSLSKTIPLYRDPIIEINVTLQTLHCRPSNPDLNGWFGCGILASWVTAISLAGVEAGKTLDTAAIVKNRLVAGVYDGQLYGGPARTQSAAVRG